MAIRNGTQVDGIPFEQRYQPPGPRRRKHERLTASDRLVCAVLGAFLGFVLWTVGYVIVAYGFLKAAARQDPAVKGPIDPLAGLPPFWWGCPVAAGFALFGAAVGAERLMDRFEKVFEVEGEAARAVDRA